MSFNFCPKCGLENTNLDPFCSNCGHGVSDNKDLTNKVSKKETSEIPKTSSELAADLWITVKDPNVKLIPYELRIRPPLEERHWDACDECGTPIKEGELIPEPIYGTMHHESQIGKWHIGGEKEKFLGAYPVEIGPTPTQQCRMGRIKDWSFPDLPLPYATGFPTLIWKGPNYIRMFIDWVSETRSQRKNFPPNSQNGGYFKEFGIDVLMLPNAPAEEILRKLSNLRSLQPPLSQLFSNYEHSTGWWVERVELINKHTNYIHVDLCGNPIYIGPPKKLFRKIDKQRSWEDSPVAIKGTPLNELELFFKQLQHK